MPKPYFESGNNKIQEIIRVNHAGEFGAKRIYEGQIKYTKDPKERALIQHMLEQELEHLKYFEEKIAEGVRPTFLIGAWNITGYLLGLLSARLGTKTAMLVTESVEEVIEQHYGQQIDYLEETGVDLEMLKSIRKFRQDEIDHKHIAVENDSRDALLAPLLSGFVKNICRGAIFISKRI
jgi:ubiquinone biosynthesis monooxygenase Coq7